MRHLLLILATILLASCATRVRTIEKPVHIVEYRDRIERDTIEHHDSIYVARYVMQRGDTIYCRDTIYRWRTEYRDCVTLVHDSVPYPVTITETVTVEDKTHKRLNYLLLSVCTALMGLILVMHRSKS